MRAPGHKLHLIGKRRTDARVSFVIAVPVFRQGLHRHTAGILPVEDFLPLVAVLGKLAVMIILRLDRYNALTTGVLQIDICIGG